MPSEEREKSKLTPEEAEKLISDFKKFMEYLVMDEAQRQRLLRTTEPDETLREIMSISSDARSTVEVLTKLQAMLPPIIDLYAEYATQDEFDQFLLDFDTAINGMQSELEAREQRLRDINAGRE